MYRVVSERRLTGHPSSMLSGGADASITLWDLEAAQDTSKTYTHSPIDTISKLGSSSCRAAILLEAPSQVPFCSHMTCFSYIVLA